MRINKRREFDEGWPEGSESSRDFIDNQEFTLNDIAGVIEGLGTGEYQLYRRGELVLFEIVDTD